MGLRQPLGILLLSIGLGALGAAFAWRVGLALFGLSLAALSGLLLIELEE